MCECTQVMNMIYTILLPLTSNNIMQIGWYDVCARSEVLSTTIYSCLYKNLCSYAAHAYQSTTPPDIHAGLSFPRRSQDTYMHIWDTCMYAYMWYMYTLLPSCHAFVLRYWSNFNGRARIHNRLPGEKLIPDRACGTTIIICPAMTAERKGGGFVNPLSVCWTLNLRNN